MGKDEKQRQKARMKKAAKQKARKTTIQRALAHQAERDRAIDQEAFTWPILECWESDSLVHEKSKFGSMIVTRKLNDSRMITGIFLIDAGCLGVKNAILKRVDIGDYKRILSHLRESEGTHPITPECAKRLIEEAIDYARGLGFEPHDDYHEAKMILEGIDAALCSRSYQFGVNGKPFYLAGPYDSEAFQTRVVRTLTAKVGPGGFDYMFKVG